MAAQGRLAIGSRTVRRITPGFFLKAQLGFEGRDCKMTTLQLNRRNRSLPAPALTLLFAVVAGLHFLSASSNAAEIVFLSSDYIFGKAQMSSTVRSGSHNLTTNAYGKSLGRLTANSSVSLSEVYATLSAYRSGYTHMFEFNTVANPGNYSPGVAQIYTTYPTPNSGVNWVYFTTRAASPGEYTGKPITVTFRATAQGTIKSPDGQACAFYEVYSPAGRFLYGRDTQSRYNPATVTYKTTIGKQLAFAMNGAAQGTKRAAASLTLKLDITAK